jgi:hypothetical protein
LKNIFEDAPEFIDLDNQRLRGMYTTSYDSIFNKIEAQLPQILIKDKTVLDLGACMCYAGYYSIVNGAKFYTGVEVQPTYASLGQTLLTKYIDTTKFKVVQQDVLKYLDDCIAKNIKFDIVLAAGVLYGFSEPIGFLSKICNVAKETVIIDSKWIPSGRHPDVGLMTVVKHELMPLAGDSDEHNNVEGVGTRMCMRALDIIMETGSFGRVGDLILPKPITDAHDPYNETKTYLNGTVGPYKFIARYDKIETHLRKLEDVVVEASRQQVNHESESTNHSKMFNFEYEFNPELEQNNLSIKFRKITRPIGTLKEECIRTSQYIKEQAGDKPLYVAFSGGIDSEVVCRAFMEAGIEFTAFTVKFANNLNYHDVRYVDKFCEYYNIPLKTVEIDAYDFFQNGIEKYIEQGYYSNRMIRYYLMFVLETIQNMGGVCVGGGGETHYVATDDGLCVPFKADTLVPRKWIENNGLHFLEFFRTTPEISAAYHQDELVQFLTKDPTYFYKPDVWLFQPEKVMLYHRIFPDMLRRQKYVGMEQILELKAKVDDALAIRFADQHLTTAYIPLDTVKKQLGIL